MKLFLKYLLFTMLFVVSSCGEIIVGFEDDELIHVSNSSLFFEADGGSDTIYVRTYNSLPCTAECSAPWVEIRKKNDTDGLAFCITVSAETLEQIRTAEVWLSIEGYYRTVYITQGCGASGLYYIDLGLSSGVKWAACNVGATKPEEFGGYYAWGETEEKIDFGLISYKWYDYATFNMTKYCTGNIGGYNKVDNKTVLDPEDDVAHVKWGGDWRMPTLDEFYELCSECTWLWTNYNYVYGYLVTGPNGNSIFLPAAGFCRSFDAVAQGVAVEGFYWSSSLSDSNFGAMSLLFSSDDSFSAPRYYVSNYHRYYGLPVRPVWDSGQSR